MFCYEELMLIFDKGTLHDVHIDALNVLVCLFFYDLKIVSLILNCHY